MKRILLFLAIVVMTIGARAQNIARLPANTPWPAKWDNPNSTNMVLNAVVFYGTNKVATLTTNDYTLLGATNGVRTFWAPFPGVPEGTNIVTLIFVDEFGRQSPSSPALSLTVLGFPVAPLGLGKL